MASSPRTLSRSARHAQVFALVVLVGIGLVILAGLAARSISVLARSDRDGGSAPPPATGAHTTLASTVERVVDGDTLVADVGGHADRVRLIGIDTPETVSPTKPVQCYGKQASDHLKALLPRGTPIVLVTDADTRDVYGRLLAYVYRPHDGLFVNLELARDGYASLLTYPPNVTHEPQFATAVGQARQHRVGLWGLCGGPGVPLAAAPSTSVGDPHPGG